MFGEDRCFCPGLTDGPFPSVSGKEGRWRITPAPLQCDPSGCLFAARAGHHLKISNRNRIPSQRASETGTATTQPRGALALIGSRIPLLQAAIPRSACDHIQMPNHPSGCATLQIKQTTPCSHSPRNLRHCAPERSLPTRPGKCFRRCGSLQHVNECKIRIE